jgi:hypothetical protein
MGFKYVHCQRCGVEYLIKEPQSDSKKNLQICPHCRINIDDYIMETKENVKSS